MDWSGLSRLSAYEWYAEVTGTEGTTTSPVWEFTTNDDCTSPVDCDDGDICTDDTCNNGTCEYAYNTAPCDDGDACTEGDVCDNGTCIAGIPMTCDDDDPCTDDYCVDGSCEFSDNGSCNTDAGANDAGSDGGSVESSEVAIEFC